MNNIESLKFELKEKEEKLKNAHLSHFTLHKDILELIDEIAQIKEKIKILEDTAE